MGQPPSLAQVVAGPPTGLFVHGEAVEVAGSLAVEQVAQRFCWSRMVGRIYVTAGIAILIAGTGMLIFALV